MENELGILMEKVPAMTMLLTEANQPLKHLRAGLPL